VGSRPDPPAWVRDAVFYQVFPDRFARSGRVPAPGDLEPWDAPPTRDGFKGGDLIGIVDRLDYLADLGVNALYLNPIFSSAANHRYHTYDYLRVDPLLGGDPAFDGLLAAAHGRGMRVILDGVFNHSGRGFWPFHHVAETGATSPYRDWFHLDPAVQRGDRPLRPYPSGSEMAALEAARSAAGTERAGEASRAVLGYEAWWDLPALPKLNVGHAPMREYLLSAAEHWVRRGIDGWRLDVPEEIADDDFWREFRTRVKGADRDAYLVAEIWHVAPQRLEGDQFDATMNYPLAEAILGFAGGSHLDMDVIGAHGTYGAAVRPLDGVAFGERLGELLAAYDPRVTAAQLNLLGSHDLPRFVTMCGGDRTSLRLATLIQMTLPGAPCLYYGDEIGLEGGMDPGCRGAFPWDAARWDVGLREAVREAIALRHAHPALRHGTFRVVATDAASVAYARSDDDERLLVAINAGDAPAALEMRLPEAAGRRLRVLAVGGRSDAQVGDLVVAEDGATRLDLPGRSGVVLRAG
jgi:neopullulanase